ncbi:MAG: hypothetical protein C5B59_19870 [Bacteroidetes bacterium]|nr:MAG: hypothetical protein C5B59_19870 [Bacteroidota bacterium]
MIQGNKLLKILLPIGLLLMQSFIATAQQTVVDSSVLDRLNELEKKVASTKPGEDHVMIVGLATMGFATYKTTNTLNGTSTVTKGNSFPDADHFELSPMFLWRHGNKFLVEFEPSFSNNGLSVNWANVSWFAAPGLIIRAGYFVLPLGTYAKREAAGWINKLATDPMGVADMTPTDYGVEVSGGQPLGNMKFNYDFALTNGNQLQADGTITSGNIVDNNNNKTFTGRLGLLPFSNSSLEVGVSGMFGKVGDQGSEQLNTMAKVYAFDLNFVKLYKPILVNIKAQYNIQDIDKVYYTNPSDSSLYTFNNHTTAYFVQGSIRPTGAEGFIKNIELAGRYTSFNTPTNSSFGSDQHTITVGLNYWFSWRTVFKVTYESYKGNSTASKLLGFYSGTTTTNTLFIHFAIQL